MEARASEQPLVERLELSARPEMLSVFTHAFAEQAFIPAIGRHPPTVRRVMKGFLRMFGKSRTAMFHGIRQEGRLACCSVVADPTDEPSPLAAFMFFLELIRALGVGLTSKFGVIAGNQPKYDQRYLELVLVATLPTCQGHGFGRRMLQFIIGEAKRQNCAGVMLLTDRSSPACALYLKMGFEIETEFKFADVTLCWMRRSG